MSRTHVVALFVIGALLTLSGCQGSDGPSAPTPPRPNALIFATPNTFAQVAAGGWTCAVRGDGAVECWGDNTYGQAPAFVSAASSFFTQVAPGTNSHTCALRSDGVVECWGLDFAGEAPLTKSAVSGVFTQVTTGQQHTCALRNDGVAECWGFNGSGQAPSTKSAVSGVLTQVTAGLNYTCALRSDGVIECWGSNGGGAAPPTRAASAGSFTQVDAGMSHTCALRNDGVVECWGLNSSGEAPASKSASSGSFTQISAGLQHSCALRTDGVVECWGNNGHGQAPATRAAGTGAFTQVSAGAVHTCARRTDGVVECWGSNESGQAPALRLSGHAPPAAVFSATPATVLPGESFTLALADAEVPDHPDAITSFTYAFDCGDGNGYGAFGSSSTALCTANTVGTQTVKGTVQDADGDQTEYTATVAVVEDFNFLGFFAPVDNNDILNLAKAGKTIPLKWRLVDGNGTPVTTLAAVKVTVATLPCDLGTTADAIEEYAAGQSGLQNLGDGYYQFNWATRTSYAKSCKTLQLDLGDGNPRTALFQFTK